MATSTPLAAAAGHPPRGARRVTPASTVAWRLLGGAGLVLLLVHGLAGGLRRAGWEIGLPQAAAAHAALMVGGFFAAVIGVERAVALRAAVVGRRGWMGWVWWAPAASAGGALALLAAPHRPGAWALGAWALVGGAALFVATSLAVLWRQRAAHTVLLLCAALSGLLGAWRWAVAAPADGAVAAWLGFLVLTIAAERLEMTRLQRRRPAALVVFGLLVAGLLAAVAAWPTPVAFGLCLAGLGAWLACFDVARITLHARGLSRYMAVALLAGYGWLAVAGAAWAGLALGWPLRDAAVHALALGFVFSMVMAHAPVILPAVAGVKLAFGPAFYLPLTLLHLGLVWRLAGPWLATAAVAHGLPPALRGAARWGALLNAGALGLFALTVLHAAWRWRRLHPA